MNGRRWFALFALGLGWIVVPVCAQQYTIELKNGSTFLSRYPPEEAPWDATKVVFLSEFGNLISVSTADIASVSSDLEAKGYGRMLNATTMALGWAPNDAIDPDSEEGQAQARMERYLEAIGGGSDASQSNNVDQFVDPAEAGGGGFAPGWPGSAPAATPPPFLPPMPGMVPPTSLTPTPSPAESGGSPPEE